MHKISYWLISLLTIIYLFLLIFGLCAWVVESGVNQVKVVSMGLSALGICIIALSLHWPRLLFGTVIQNGAASKNYAGDKISSLILGMSFLSGGLLYAYFLGVGAIVVSFVVGVALIRLRGVYLNSKHKH